MNRPVVMVEWLDAVGCAQGWHEDTLLKPKYNELVKSVGYLLDENDEFILVAGHVLRKQVQGAIAIPKDMIRSWWEIDVDC
jgi:hypothetical protein